MSVNHYQPHVFVLPEDDANRQIVNGFILDLNLNSRAIQVLPPAGGWKKVVEKFTNDYASTMRQYPQRMIILLIDFDEDKDRLIYVKHQIPDDLKNRVFVLGVLSEPESLRRDINKSFEKIGEALAKDCSDNTNELWEHDLLTHNKTELVRLISSVKLFLFNLK
ncbi:hypothetical protein [Nostoc sp. TCL240-02]|uniref:hypothetical protein n=1 Tax=Nostoc sp. TCL240-02 TaxID=2572090 RepID=UPI00157FBABC|nr:hypothetical protein [Nostoc sp. TCL240-02]QKQ77238.1 hypothetical protein FBB35_31610 [Nostoc sp. TCL240-02]